MIYNQWYIILESKEVKKRKALLVKRMNMNLSLWRDETGKVCCIDDRCCHRGASLSCGKTVKGNLECPFHGFLFDKNGKVILIPANGKNKAVPETMKVKSYDTFEAYGWIWMWWGDPDKKTQSPAFFNELIPFSYSTLKDNWKIHYSRAIENQLDVVHLPFVHKSTIGRGNRTLVHGPVVEREGDLLTFYVLNVEDDGKTIAMKPEEIQNFKDLFRLQFRFPNTWQNLISDKLRIFAAFVPVDNDNTLIYVRFYQNFIKIPLLKGFMNWTGKISNRIILRQDKRIVVTQQPSKSEYKMSERLIVGDLPIIEYRKYRQELKEKNPLPTT